MQIRRMVFPLLAVLSAAALLTGCGSSTKETMPPATGVVLSASTPTVGLATCTTCHTKQTDDWMNTRHANLNSSPSYTSATSSCQACHDQLKDSGQLSPPRYVIGCESCHGGGQLHAETGGSGPILRLASTLSTATLGTVTVSPQFQTCTRCHQLLNSSGTVTTPQHSTDAARTITDTHFASPSSWSNTSGSNAYSTPGTNAIFGYSLEYASETVCTACHNPHGIVGINQEWAQSAHADRGGTPNNYFSGAWAYYNWSCDKTSTAGCGSYGTPSDRKACQRCHTTSGFRAYADALRKNEDATAQQIREGVVSSVTYTAGWKPEMLTCNGCHTDFNGTLRNPGAITANYDLIMSYPTSTYASNTYAVNSHTYPDVAASNICMACHTGRVSGKSIQQLNQPGVPTVDFSNLGFDKVNSHYLSAGGTVFTETGYEFPGLSYANIASYRHDQIGSTAVPNSGTNGPCVGCHMSRPGGNGNHLFMPVSRSMTTIGQIDGIASEVCISCHTASGAGGLEDLANERKDEFSESLEALAYVLGQRGFAFREAYPYFYQIRTASTPTITVAMTNGSATVTGNGTLWTSGTSSIVLGASPDYFKVDGDGVFYKIIAVTNDTTLTLEKNYAGANSAGTNFTIAKSGSANGIVNWLTQTGTGVTAATSSDTLTSGEKTGKNNLGAAFNLNLLLNDPGAYVHNRMYAKRLIYDAIDWADNNKMDFSAGTTLSTKLPADAIYKAGAVKYLLPYGVLGIPAERP